MEENSRYKYIKLLLICVVALVCFLLLITFSNDKSIPSWKQIGNSIFGSKASETDNDFIVFIDVGQGDSILISSNGFNALIDFGTAAEGGENVVDALYDYGVDSLDCIVATHYDSDHIGGGPEVFNAFKVHNALIPEVSDRETEAYESFEYALDESGALVYTARLGTVINIGDFELTVIGYYYDEEDSNDQSIIIMADIDGIKFLLAGDAGEAVEERLIDDKIMLDCDVYKASHHGSRNSNTAEFIKAASPEYAVISAGKGNRYGHPHDEVLEIFDSVDAEVLRTDVSGDIIFRIENSEMVIATEY